MKTISAKELRDNLEQYVKLTRRGETVRVTYRSKPAFTLQPEKSSSGPVPGTREATKIFLQKADALRSKADFRIKLAKGMTYKEIYYEDMAKKYGFDR